MRIDLTRSKTYEVAYPYDGNALDTSNILREHYWTHRDIDFLKTPKKNELFVYGGRSNWGSRRSDFVQTNKYLQAGMENEDFYGWGLEDRRKTLPLVEFWLPDLSE